ncbi:MAG: hypothetical protein JWN71_2055 [Xanthobacteraceae bacterium]|jgi:tyrosinase|nr:hypothetical protein [Xanthobacteraceae bacterium]
MTVTRRNVVATGLSSLAVSAWIPGAAAQATRTRFSATSPQGKQNLVKYAKAVDLMMNQIPKGDPRHWEFQWYSHWIPGPQQPWSAVMSTKTTKINQVYTGKPPNDPNRLLAQAMWDNCQAHGLNPSDPNFFQERFFLPWHRYFVYFFEEVIRGVLNDTTFTLPYWDYLSGNVSDLSIPPEFRVPQSPLFRPNRNPWVNAGQRIDQQNPGSINLNAFKETTYINGSIGFCPILDNNPHGQVHGAVGNSTNMGQVPTAGGDPIFWLHHCNIDRLWESWNRLPGRINPPWPDRSFPFADGNGKAISVKTAGANRVALLKYQYDKYYQPKVVPKIPVANPNLLAMSVATTRLAAPEPVKLDSDIVRVALSPGTSTLATPQAPKNLLALSAVQRQQYLILGGIQTHDETASTYNVYLDLPEGAATPGPGDPHYVGTLNLFNAAGHEGHTTNSHDTAFNVTDQVKALQAAGKLTPTPTVTLNRRGAEQDKPNVEIGQILLIES